MINADVIQEFMIRFIKEFKEGGNKEVAICFILIILLALLNYGTFWLRGGYADDFNFLAFSSGKSYLEAVVGWSANARFSQAIVMPLLMQSLSGDSPMEFNWALFHLFGLVAFVISVVAYNQILEILGASRILNLSTCLIFALYPIKNEALLWPSTIVGYVIALLFFLVAVWLYLKQAKADKESVFSLVAVWLLLLFAMFFIEQLVPLVVLVVIIRLLLFRRTFPLILVHGTGLVALFIIFLWVNFFSAASEKLTRYTGDEVSLISNTLNVLYKSVYNALVYPAQIILDPYYWIELKEVVTNFQFLFAVVILTLLCWCMLIKRRSNYPKTSISKFPPWFYLGGGIVIWIAAFSPLMVISYYLPNRVFYIPLLGFSLAGGAMIELIVSNNKKSINYAIALLLFFLCSVFIIVNQYSQSDFTKQWQDQKQVMHTMKRLEKKLNKNDTINLINFPKKIGPAPEFINWFAFSGMLDWMYPALDLKGDIQAGLSDVFNFSETSETSTNRSLSAKNGHIVLLWSDIQKKPIQVNSLLLYKKRKKDTTSRRGVKDKGVVLGELRSLDLEAMMSEGNQMSVDQVLKLPEFDLALLRIKLTVKEFKERTLRLVVHARLSDGSIKPYDRAVTMKDTGWARIGNNLVTEIQIKKISNVTAVKFGLTKNGILMETGGDGLVLSGQFN
ncbi:MAG: hypothetical protein GY941_12660 [Planctomycetes bacterium]|nr:hypothetical protein [Planctomycetota bacterium]